MLDGEDLPDWIPLFDPQHFQQEHQQLLLKDWQLNQDELLQLANQVSEIRKMIDQRAARHANVDDQPLLQQHVVD